MDHSGHSDSGLLKVFVADSTLTCFWLVTKVCHSPDEKFPASKVLESSVCLVGQALEERALAWSSPFKLAKMITIWPQNRCISPGLAGNRDFVFPLRMACLHPPSSSDVGSSKGGQTITLGRKPVYSSKDLLKKNFFENKRHVCYCGWLFGQKVIVRCPPRCLVSSWKPAPRWSGGSTQAGTRMIRD